MARASRRSSSCGRPVRRNYIGWRDRRLWSPNGVDVAVLVPAPVSEWVRTIENVVLRLVVFRCGHAGASTYRGAGAEDGGITPGVVGVTKDLVGIIVRLNSSYTIDSRLRTSIW